jgi:hypothetical protein
LPAFQPHEEAETAALFAAQITAQVAAVREGSQAEAQVPPLVPSLHEQEIASPPRAGGGGSSSQDPTWLYPVEHK